MVYRKEMLSHMLKRGKPWIQRFLNWVSRSYWPFDSTESWESRSLHLVLTSREKSPPRRRTERASWRHWTAGVVERLFEYATLMKKFKILSIRARTKSSVLMGSARTFAQVVSRKRILSCSAGRVGWFGKRERVSREDAGFGEGDRVPPEDVEIRRTRARTCWRGKVDSSSIILLEIRQEAGRQCQKSR